MLKDSFIKLVMPVSKKHRSVEPPDDMSAKIARLTRQNASLRREVERLQVYRAMAYRDPLTGLWNRRYAEERLREEISRCRRTRSGARFSVLLIDINDFKNVNDLHGHAAGDEMLKWVGEFLIGHLRTHDVPCRTGGDEFMVLLPDLSEGDSAVVVARLRDQLRLTNGERKVPVSLSIGAASWPESGESAERLLALADEAMYRDKRDQKAGRRSAGEDRPAVTSLAAVRA